MANIKSAQKQARKNIVRRDINLARSTAIRTAVKKVLTALERKEDANKINELLKEASAQLSRAKNKGTIHANTASRKISRLAKRVAQETRQARA